MFQNKFVKRIFGHSSLYIIKEMMFKLHSEEIIDCSIGFVLLGDYVMQAPCILSNNRLY